MTEINKYNTAMIYSIRSPATEKYYIGSTTQILCKRFGDHKTKYKGYLKGTGCFITSFKILKLGDAYIELLEEVNCENRNQLEKREGELIREHKNNCVNKSIAGRTQKEYKIDNIDKTKQYGIDNIEIILKRSKQYYDDNKEFVKANNKQYYNDNKDKILESIKAKAKLQYLCACGLTITTGVKARHNKTAKHLKALEQEIIIV